LADGVLGWAVPVQRQPALIEVGGRARKRLVWSGIGTALLLGVFGAGWSGAGSGVQGPGWSEVAQGARALLGYGLVTFVTAGVTGLLLGASSANGPRSLDAALVRTVEVAGALPAVLWAAAVGQTLGSGLVFAVVLGGIRGLDVAWTLRAELLRRAHHDDELGLRSLGHYPLSAYYRHRLRPAVLPALCTLFVTPAWWVATGAVGHLLGPRAIPGKRGWDVLLAGTESGAASLGAAALIALVTWVLLGFVTAAPRRVGALRSSIPPPLHTRA
jgi:ABC-type dipeptide/oligopeptide/nickel transport system permease subunit